jgi:hypothetical protein
VEEMRRNLAYPVRSHPNFGIKGRT